MYKKVIAGAVAGSVMIGIAHKTEYIDVDREGATFRNPFIERQVEGESAQPTAEEGKRCVNISELSTEVKAGQTIMALVRAEDAERTGELAQHRIGGFAVVYSMSKANIAEGRGAGDTQFFGKTLLGTKQQIEQATGLPAGIGLDEEGGLIQRTKSLDGARNLPSARQQTKDMSLTDITNMYREHSAWLRTTFGININFAPVTDVGDGTQLGDRSYGTDVDTVTRNAGAAIQGMQQAEVAATLKHFPGLGHLNVDTHEEKGVTPELSILEQTEIPAFKLLIDQAKPRYVMVGHGIVPNLTNNLPASLAPQTYDYLRNKLGFRGVIFTDDLKMNGVSDDVSADRQKKAAVTAFDAGADVLLVHGVNDAIAVQDEIENRASADKSLLERLNDKAARVAQAKGVKTCS